MTVCVCSRTALDVSAPRSSDRSRPESVFARNIAHRATQVSGVAAAVREAAAAVREAATAVREAGRPESVLLVES